MLLKQTYSDFLGSCTYTASLGQQRKYFTMVSENGQGHILGLEHPPCITLGKRGEVEQDLNYSPSLLRSQGFEVHFVDRGGQATLHSPGQLVIYPILPLKQWQLGVREYVLCLQKATIDLLADFGVESLYGESEPGVYTEKGKIAFFGIRVNQGVSQHGLAINVSNDLRFFQTIRSCGVPGEQFDRMANHSVDAPLNELFLQWVSHFSSRLNLTPISPGD